MARKTETLVIDAPGRDQGKTYVLTEMPAMEAVRWATRAFLALARGGVDLPDDIGQMGMAGIARVGVKALGGVSFQDAEPLMADMLACARFVPDPTRPMVTRPVDDTNTEEPTTVLRLQRAILALHVDFSGAGVLST